jgi:hypothetical protein
MNVAELGVGTLFHKLLQVEPGIPVLDIKEECLNMHLS